MATRGILRRNTTVGYEGLLIKGMSQHSSSLNLCEAMNAWRIQVHTLHPTIHLQYIKSNKQRNYVA